VSSTLDEHDGPGTGGDWPPGEQPLDVRVRQVWTAQSAITTAVMALVVLGAEVGARLAGLEGWPTGLGAALVALIGGVLTWRLPSATWRRWRLELAPEALELRHGVVTFIHSAIPYHRVQYIDLKSGPIERAFGLTRLVVHTAAASTDAEIPGLATPRAEALRRVLLERAGVGDAV
jgi:membrane protein YdbS with pleckstrin-like domain